MNQKKKIVGCGITSLLWGAVVLGGIIIGGYFLMRGCLSKWDTFGVMGWPGVTEDQKSLVIVKSYSKTESYSRNGGFVRKSYSTTYYLEKIDLETGKVSKKTRLMSHSKIKKGGLECFGGYKDRLWIYANYLRAYDMNTLEQVVKIEDIETKNPSLKGKMPVESQYYDAHVNLGYIIITALDGDKYKIMLDDLRAELVDAKPLDFKDYNKSIQAEQDALKLRMDSLYAEFSGVNYSKHYEEYSRRRSVLENIQDSLRDIEENAREIFEYNQELQRDLEEFDQFFTDDVSDWTIDKDTMMGYGFWLNKEEPNEKRFDYTNFSSSTNESEKLTMYKMKLEYNKEASSRYDRLLVTNTESFKERYLQGGMMIDYKTARAYKAVDPGGYIIFSRDIIGNKGKLMVSRVSIEGKQLWQTDTKMSFDVVFCMATRTHLIIGGILNQEEKPSFTNADGLRIIDLKTGNIVEVKY